MENSEDRILKLNDILSQNIEGTRPDKAFETGDIFNEFPCAIITMVNDANSTSAARKVLKSIADTKSDLLTVLFPATTPDTLEYHLSKLNLSLNNWTYPTEPGVQKRDLKSGMMLTGYNAKDIKKVISCMVSHMRLWHLCALFDTPMVILEHDALFVRKFEVDKFPSLNGGIVGLNDPRGATRKSAVYYDKVTLNSPIDRDYPHIKPVPYVDNDELAPQGLAGNSAYLIYPGAAGYMLKLVKEHGMWPNDALMCKQLVPYLSHAFPFYTKLQGVASTTQG